eukprot:gene4507-6369_t
MYESSIRFLQLADWGGSNKYPFHNPSQTATANAMATVGADLKIQFILALGDNFYNFGIQGTSQSPRFNSSWNHVYYQDALMVPWLVCAGNHDHRGNVTSQIEYSKLNSRWVYPSLYHKHHYFSLDNSVSLDVILIDTTSYTGVNYGIFPSNVADIAQHRWIEESLANSTADYIIVGGHYPVYSVCDHGNTITLINHLKPLLDKYQAHYMSGHDHCAEHFIVNDTNYWLNGIGHGCCYQSTMMNEAPGNSLKYLISNDDFTVNIDDDHVEEGINGTVGGFSSIIITKQQMVVNFINQNQTVLYSSTVYPRTITRLVTRKSNSSSEFGIIFGITTVGLLFIVGLILLFYNIVKKKKNNFAANMNNKFNKLKQKHRLVSNDEGPSEEVDEYHKENKELMVSSVLHLDDKSHENENSDVISGNSISTRIAKISIYEEKETLLNCNQEEDINGSHNDDNYL